MANKIKLLGLICGILLLSQLINLYTQGWLNQFGLLPRDVRTLPYIFTTIFIHGSWGHLINNTIGLLVFGSLCLLRGNRYFLLSSAFIIIFTGFLVWCFARPAIHIGASGWVFGLWSLSIALAWFQRSLVNISIAIFVLIFYSGMLYGVLPTNAEISFESHFFGALSGVIYAWLSSTRTLKRAN